MAIQTMGFFQMLRNGWTMLGNALEAGAIGANSLKNTAIWAEETTAKMVDDARADRAEAAAERQLERAKRMAAIQAAAQTPTTTTNQQTLLN